MCDFTQNLHYFVVRHFVSQNYIVLSRGNFCRKFMHFLVCQCKKSDKYEVCSGPWGGGGGGVNFDGYYISGGSFLPPSNMRH